MTAIVCITLCLFTIYLYSTVCQCFIRTLARISPFHCFNLIVNYIILCSLYDIQNDITPVGAFAKRMFHFNAVSLVGQTDGNVAPSNDTKLYCQY